MGTSDKPIDAIVGDLVAEAIEEMTSAAMIHLDNVRHLDVDDPRVLIYLRMSLAATRCALEVYVDRQTSRLAEKEKT